MQALAMSQDEVTACKVYNAAVEDTLYSAINDFHSHLHAENHRQTQIEALPLSGVLLYAALMKFACYIHALLVTISSLSLLCTLS